MIHNALTIGGSDPSGGAGIQADIKAFSANGVYAMSVITALTAQNTQGVAAIHTPPSDFFTQQLKAVFDDCLPSALKLGMLANSDVIEALVKALDKYDCEHKVLDPVMVSTSGHSLLEPDAISLLKEQLIPRMTLITPNLIEAAFLLEQAVPSSIEQMQTMAEALVKTYDVNVLLKGGHLDSQTSPDLLLTKTGEAHWFETKRIDTKNTHGTGCTLSAAIVAHLAKLPCGLSESDQLAKAVEAAKDYVSNAIGGADQLSVGRGNGPTHHFAKWW